jgi:hypothetical protein
MLVNLVSNKIHLLQQFLHDNILLQQVGAVNNRLTFINIYALHQTIYQLISSRMQTSSTCAGNHTGLAKDTSGNSTHGCKSDNSITSR